MNNILARLIRKQIYFILIVLISFSLISCGNKGPLTVPESYNDAKLKLSLLFISNNDYKI